VLLLPLASPLVIAGVRATDLALGGPAPGEGLPWVQLTVAIGAIYLGVALAVIDHVLDES
jgi:ABC-type transport system involved in cytochrome c biogenesis permease component